MPAAAEPKDVAPEASLVVDMGRKKKKQIKQLRRGTGKLLAQVQGCIDELKSSGKISGAVRPVIVVVREKRKRRMLGIPGI